MEVSPVPFFLTPLPTLQSYADIKEFSLTKDFLEEILEPIQFCGEFFMQYLNLTFIGFVLHLDLTTKLGISYWSVFHILTIAFAVVNSAVAVISTKFVSLG